MHIHNSCPKNMSISFYYFVMLTIRIKKNHNQLSSYDIQNKNNILKTIHLIITQFCNSKLIQSERSWGVIL